MRWDVGMNEIVVLRSGLCPVDFLGAITASPSMGRGSGWTNQGACDRVMSRNWIEATSANLCQMTRSRQVLCRRSMVVLQQPTQALPTGDALGDWRLIASRDSTTYRLNPGRDRRNAVTHPL